VIHVASGAATRAALATVAAMRRAPPALQRAPRAQVLRGDREDAVQPLITSPIAARVKSAARPVDGARTSATKAARFASVASAYRE